MPGAGGLLAANYLYAQAPQDGTTFGIVHSSVPLTPLWGNKGVRFDTLKFNWLGSLDRDRRHVHRLAHLADQDLGRHAGA